jgi:hypothetical protein
LTSNRLKQIKKTPHNAEFFYGTKKDHLKRVGKKISSREHPVKNQAKPGKKIPMLVVPSPLKRAFTLLFSN